MWDIARLSRETSQSPSEYWEIQTDWETAQLFETIEGEVPDHALDCLCFDFDRAILRFRDWMEQKQDEQTIGQKSGREPNHERGETWVQKYPYQEQIFDLYRDRLAGTRRGTSRLDPIVAGMSDADFYDLFDA